MPPDLGHLRRLLEDDHQTSRSSLLRRIIDNSPAIIYVKDLEGRHLVVNRAWEELTGITQEEAFGRTDHELFPEHLANSWQLTDRETIQARRPVRFEETNESGGTTRTYLTTKFPLLDESGEMVGVGGISTDVTERKRLEESLRQRHREYAAIVADHKRTGEALRQSESDARASETRIRALLNTIPDLMFLQSKDGVYLDYHARNPEDLLLPPQRFLGRNMHEVLPAPLADMFGRLFGQALSSAEPVLIEYSLPIQGEQRWYEARVIAAEDDKVLSIVRDITARKRAEHDLHDAQAALAKLTRVATMGELVASIAHEVNQPLAAIANNGQVCLRWLEEGKIDELKDALEDIVRDGRRAAEVVSRVRTFVEPREAIEEEIDVNDIVNETLALARQEIVRHAAEVRTQLTPGLTRVRGDRVQLQQVLLNLIVNALEAMASIHDRRRRLRIVTSPAANGGVRVSVRDWGVGLDPARQENLFEAFVTTKPHGMGMGLTISRSIIAAHGGRLTAHGNPRHGTTFEFTLPAPS
jgi:PAS domain S-box-containing protein